jgi:NADPH:quinone reductase-like Zn-dependent oxidoreductase
LQIARNRGCWVAGTASRDDKLAVAREWGVDAAYNYKSDDFVARLGQDTGGRGIDAACATIGAETLERVLACMANEGQVLMYGSTGGRVVSFDLRCGEHNVALRTVSIDSSARYYTETVPSFNSVALPAFADGRFKAVVHTELPMSELARAHAMVADRRHFGKVIMLNS